VYSAGVIDAADIHRLRLGYLHLQPHEVRDPDAAAARLWMVCAYAIRHPRGIFLWDTGIGSSREVEELLAPVRWPVEAQLRAVGIEPSEVAVVGNCHLHFDHAGGNARFPDIPILAQRIEHAAASSVEDYTLPGIAEFPGARYELLDGDAAVWDGVRIVPTPGHTDGHQSLLVETRQGRVVLAGQAVNTASDYARARLAQDLQQAGRQAGHEADAAADYPPWMDVVEAFDPWRVLFAHDLATWERPHPFDRIPRAG
jgi:glyoxylase-like metal-dependent hydrolase (beta-lactamase superfamily II)